LSQLFQRLINSKKRGVAAVDGDVHRIEINVFGATAALLGTLPAGAINENAPHRLSGRAKEMRAIRELSAAILVDQLQPGVVDQSRGLKSVTRHLARELLFGHAVQLGIDDVKQLLPGITLPAPCSFQKTR
jgi:hypothetical protein